MSMVDQMTRSAAIDPARWPDVAARPRASVWAAVSAAIVGRVARGLRIGVELPGGRRIGHADPAAPVMRLLDPEAVHRRCAAAGPLGLAEAYQAGEWVADDLPLLLATIARHLDPPRWMRRLRRHYGARRPLSQVNDVGNASRNVSHHYDLSNDLFAAFLDETMTYSSALFATGADGRPLASEQTLAEAQHRKIDRVLDLAHVRPGTRLLEIGTGWGQLAVAAAARGAFVHTVTLSAAQADLARTRIAAAGFADRVRVDLCDYRQIQRTHPAGYDAIVSVEMIEAVGERFWPVYLQTLDGLLAPGGTVVLQAITSSHELMLRTRRIYTWIQKYIFPGGLVPSVRALEQACARHTGLRLQVGQAFGAHYAQTLRLWRERFQRRHAQLAALGFDETFRRTWELYLSYSEAGFVSGHLDVHHLTLERPA